MNYHNITKCDMMNGEGLRVVLWVSGCEHGCKGCHNPCTWKPDSGLSFDKSAKHELFTELEKGHIDGITLSGGDPLHPMNVGTIRQLILDIRTIFPNKTVWLYTGYTDDEIRDIPVLRSTRDICDVVVTGRFVQELHSPDLKWFGSSNQKILRRGRDY